MSFFQKIAKQIQKTEKLKSYLFINKVKMIDRDTLDDVILKQRDRIKGELRGANRAVYSAVGIHVLEMLNDADKKYGRSYMTEEEIAVEFYKEHDKRFEYNDITSAINKLIKSKKLAEHKIEYSLNHGGWFTGYKLAE